MRTGKYLYGIVDSKERESFGKIGVNNSEVYTIQYEDVGVAVSDIPVDHEIKIEEARTHEKALRKIMETHTIIPMSFGVVAKDGAEIKNILKQARIRFKNTMEKIRKKLQINVTISFDKDIMAEILGEDKEIQELAAQAKRNNADENFKIVLGSKVKTVLERRRNEYKKDIQDCLRDLSDGFKENKSTDDYTLMNGSFLVGQMREQDFYKRLNEMEKKYEKELTFIAVGPLPPYNFTGIEIRKMDFNYIEEARKIFGLDQETSLSEVESAYEHIAKKYHPDLHPDDPFAGEKFKKIRGAYEVLTNYCQHYICSLEKSQVEATLLIQERTR